MTIPDWNALPASAAEAPSNDTTPSSEGLERASAPQPIRAILYQADSELPTPTRPYQGISIQFVQNLECIKYAQPIATKFCTCHCRDVCKISLWSVEYWYILNQSMANFDQISNSIEIPFVGQATGRSSGQRAHVRGSNNILVQIFLCCILIYTPAKCLYNIVTLYQCLHNTTKIEKLYMVLSMLVYISMGFHRSPGTGTMPALARTPSLLCLRLRTHAGHSFASTYHIKWSVDCATSHMKHVSAVRKGLYIYLRCSREEETRWSAINFKRPQRCVPGTVNRRHYRVVDAVVSE